MSKIGSAGILAAAIAAGAVTGIFGAGGGMILIPCLGLFAAMKEQDIFPASLSVMLPICLVSLGLSALHTPLPFGRAFPYLLGGVAGGVLAGWLGKRISVVWLHRILGCLILWGGIQKLCS